VLPICIFVTVVLVAIAAYLYGVETHLTYKELELIGFVRPLGQYVSQHPNKNDLGLILPDIALGYLPILRR